MKARFQIIVGGLFLSALSAEFFGSSLISTARAAGPRQCQFEAVGSLFSIPKRRPTEESLPHYYAKRLALFYLREGRLPKRGEMSNAFYGVREHDLFMSLDEQREWLLLEQSNPRLKAELRELNADFDHAKLNQFWKKVASYTSPSVQERKLLDDRSLVVLNYIAEDGAFPSQSPKFEDFKGLTAKELYKHSDKHRKQVLDLLERADFPQRYLEQFPGHSLEELKELQSQLVEKLSFHLIDEFHIQVGQIAEKIKKDRERFAVSTDYNKLLDRIRRHPRSWRHLLKSESASSSQLSSELYEKAREEMAQYIEQAIAVLQK